MLSLLWQIWYIIVLIFIVADGQIKKYNLVIWSHCPSATLSLSQTNWRELQINFSCEMRILYILFLHSLAVNALWFWLLLASYGPGFESQAHHLCFFNLWYWNCKEKRKKINKKRSGLAHFKKVHISFSLVQNQRSGDQRLCKKVVMSLNPAEFLMNF